MYILAQLLLPTSGDVIYGCSPVRQQRLRPVVHHASDERLNAAELRVDAQNLQISQNTDILEC